MMSAPITVKNWDKEDQPREKLMKMGARSLSTTELIAILLRTGSVGINVVDLSKQLLHNAQGSLQQLSQTPFNALQQYKGMGEAKAVTLCAALELGHRLSVERSTLKKTAIASSADIYVEFAPILGNLDHEEFWALFLNNKLEVISLSMVSQGGLSETMVDVRILFRNALAAGATALAVAHNHPTGNIKPSVPDNKLTQSISRAAKILGIRFVDHLIIGSPDAMVDPSDEGIHVGRQGTNYYSYCDDGGLEGFTV